jgi:hypothetical protein
MLNMRAAAHLGAQRLGVLATRVLAARLAKR